MSGQFSCVLKAVNHISKHFTYAALSVVVVSSHAYNKQRPVEMAQPLITLPNPLPMNS
jgi:hypothetical protein